MNAWTVTCIECGREFDLGDEGDAEMWEYGHDCEADHAEPVAYVQPTLDGRRERTLVGFDITEPIFEERHCTVILREEVRHYSDGDSIAVIVCDRPVIDCVCTNGHLAVGR